MELIIKPTGRCNFNCKFCSANLLDIKHSTTVSTQLKTVLDTIKPDNIIFTGGDPLLVSPDYYNEILSLGNWNIAFTTNLKDFYLNPEKWISLFKNPRVGIGTSFQYGNKRLWDNNTPYTEKLFIDVMQKFYDEIGYTPPFISLIDTDNEDKALDHVYLAKKLNTKCKLNGTLPLGKSKSFYPTYKMIKIWLEIKDLGLEEYLDTQIQFYEGGCNFNTSLYCESTIRTFWLNERDEVQYGNCEDCSTLGQRIPLDKIRPIPVKKQIEIKDTINDKCCYCELFKLCNACRSLQRINKQTPEHCEEMLKLKPRIIEAKWKI